MAALQTRFQHHRAAGHESDDWPARARSRQRADRRRLVWKARRGRRPRPRGQPGVADGLRQGSDVSRQHRRRRLFPLPDGRRQPEQRVVLSDRPARPGGVRFGYRSGTAAAPHRRHGQPQKADRHAADACREHRRHRHRRQQRSRQGTAAHLGRPELVLPARLLHDEHEARWSVPQDHGQGEPARRRGQGAARLSRGDGRGSQGLARGGGSARAR